MADVAAIPFHLYAYADKCTTGAQELQDWIRTVLRPSLLAYQNGGGVCFAIDTDTATQVAATYYTDRDVRVVGQAFERAGHALPGPAMPYIASDKAVNAAFADLKQHPHLSPQELLEQYRQPTDPDGTVNYLPFVGPEITARERQLLDDIGPTGQVDMYEIRRQAFGESGRRFPGENINDSHRDAFRHAYWNALMTKRFGAAWAQQYASAHEGLPHNSQVRESMDLHNNEVGRRIALRYPNADDSRLANLVQQAVDRGDVVVVDRNGDLRYSNEVPRGQTGLAHGNGGGNNHGTGSSGGSGNDSSGYDPGNSGGSGSTGGSG
jgi:uncharacterized membrane protein YgcG